MASSNVKAFYGEEINMFWWPRESGSKGYRCVNGDKGNAMGAYQFDRRYALVPFMQFCVDYNEDVYGGFKKYIKYGAGSTSLQNNQELAKLWLSYCDRNEDEFGNLQDSYAYKYYYLPAKEYCIKKGVPIDNYSPVLKGSLWSFAIRSGTETGAKKVVNAYNNGAKTELKILKSAYATYGSNDANRWSINTPGSQYSDAVAIYNESFNNKETPSESISYYVGTDWKDGKCVNQDNAYGVLDNAKKRVNTLGDKYKVFDSTGKVIYPEKVEVKEEPKKEEPKQEEPVKPVEKEPEKKEEPVPVVKEEPKKEEEVKVEETTSSSSQYPDKENEYKVCTGWKSGHTVGQMGAYTKYDNAKKQCTELANKTGKAYYVYTSKGVRLFMCDPKSVKKDVVNGYKVGTACNGTNILNQKGAFTKFENAKNYADNLSKSTGVSFKVYLEGKLQYTGSTK